MMRRPPRSTLFPHRTLFRSREPPPRAAPRRRPDRGPPRRQAQLLLHLPRALPPAHGRAVQQRSEEHTSELQSRQYLVCRLLLEKKTIDSLLVASFFPSSSIA